MSINDNVIGYKNPPTKTQFKPGLSGNPKGRPKVIRNLSEILGGALIQPIKITINGKVITVSAFEGLVLSMMNAALKGDMCAAKIVLNLPEMAARLAVEESKKKESITIVLQGADRYL